MPAWIGSAARCQAEQRLHDAVKNKVNAQKENRQNDRQDQNHDRRLCCFFPCWPRNLCGFGADLTDEFTGARFCHFKILSVSFQRVAAIAPTGGVESDIGSDFGKTSP